MPTYAWFNGFSHFYKFKDPVSLDARGVQVISKPDGAFEDPAGKFSKLFPFKLHTGSQPMETTTRQLLPLKNKYAFETGDVTTAIQLGAAAQGMTYNAHAFIPTEQYEGIYHGVGPKTTAVSCANGGCHPQLTAGANRMPFSSLGYTRRGTTAQLCDVCHGAKTYTSFTSLHSNHRDRKNCAACHGTGYPLKEAKTTLCDNCHSLKSFTTANDVHSRHVQGKGYDCANCHTFSAGMTGGHSEEH
ncbi:hypothetical protein M1B72_20400 [Geomonas paludis]|nr:hypothetical protein M1B72_20400 [Geomonas paludis]